MAEYAESICRRCFHSYVCEQFNEHRDDNNQKCHFFNDHFVPAADVAPVVHSRWIHDERMLAVCLECGMTAVEDGTDYCPNCGAKMDLEEDNT